MLVGEGLVVRRALVAGPHVLVNAGFHLGQGFLIQLFDTSSNQTLCC